jgi:hypothetical protein
MPNLASLNAHSTAIVDALDAVVKTFDAGAPRIDLPPHGGEGWGWQGKPLESPFKKYCIVYPLPGGVFDGTLGCPDDDASLIWQVTCVGATRPQCEWVADKVNETLVGQPLTIPGRYVTRVQADMAGGGVRRDDTVQPPVFIATPRYRIDSVPLGGGS